MQSKENKDEEAKEQQSEGASSDEGDEPVILHPEGTDVKQVNSHQAQVEQQVRTLINPKHTEPAQLYQQQETQHITHQRWLVLIQ